MGKGRMISSEIWEDDYFIELSLLERMIWIGLLTCSADDQGRLQDNKRLIHSQLFPVDDMDDNLIEQALRKFAVSGKITRYITDNKRVIQINNWWKYQTPRWCGKSKYSPPKGWIDRYRFHGLGNEIIELNWKGQGGYIATNTIGNTINDVNGDVNDDGEDEDDVKLPQPIKSIPPPAPAFQFSQGWQIRVFTGVTNLSGIPGSDMPKVMEALDSLRSRFTSEDELITYLKPYFENWLTRKTKDGRRYSKSNCAWLYDMALAEDTITAPKLDRVMEVFHAPKYDPDCRLCHGKGKYMSEKSGRYVECDCLKVYDEVEA